MNGLISDGGPRGRVAAWQQHAYGQLSQEMGLGWNPAAAAAILHVDPPKDASKATSIMRDLFERALPGVDWKELQSQTEADIAGFFDVSDSPFEDQTFAVPARYYLSKVLKAPLWSGEYELRLQPFVASMPALGFDTLTRTFPAEEQAVILIQHDVFMFLHGMTSAIVVALPWNWFPPKRNLLPTEESWLLTRSSAGLNLLRGREHLRSILGAYVTSGTSRAVAELPLSGMAQQWHMEVFESAATFVLAHEVSHIALGHTTRKRGSHSDTAWNREMAADGLGAWATLAVEAGKGVHPRIAALGCVLALLAWYAVDLGVHYLEAGDMELPLRPSHPSGPSRAKAVVTGMSIAADAAGGTLGQDFAKKLDDAIAHARKLVDDCVAGFSDARKAGVRPSPIWRLGAPPAVVKESE